MYRVHLADNALPFSGTWESPWRVIIIGSLADIVESTLVTDVSEPSVVSDTDWIKPGPVSWIYWAYNNGSNDYQIVKKYIDLAEEMNWPYNLIDWKWNEMGNGGDVKDAIQYAKEKGIKTLLWYNSSTSWNGEGAPGPLYVLNAKEELRGLPSTTQHSPLPETLWGLWIIPRALSAIHSIPISHHMDMSWR